MPRDPNFDPRNPREPAAATERAPARRGRVLRVKDGYNPNSSSVGSTLPTYLAFAVGSGALTVLILNLLDGAGRLLRKQRSGDPTQQAKGSGRDRDDERAEQDDD